MADWTDELKAEVIEKYKTAKPTPDTTTEIVKDIAEELGDGFTANGVRVILVKAGEYLKKTPATGKTGNGEKKSTRVNKQEALDALVVAIEASGLEADMDIIGKFTGKAALYLTEVISKTAEPETAT